MINRERIVHAFLEMVQIDSPSMYERKIADYLLNKLTELGLEVYEDQAGASINKDEPEAAAGNIIAKLKGTVPEAPVLLFSAHMDTVEPGRGIKPVVKDEIVYSDGTTILGSDDKAGIASLLEVIHILKENNIPHGDLEFVITVAEECGLKGSKELDSAKLAAQFGYVLDSDGAPGSIVTKAPSQYKIKAEVIGKAAHAGICPEEGINAIYVAAKAISKMKLGRIDEETTSNVGVINGGKATNIIPDQVFIDGETRSLDPEKLERETDLMIQILRDTAAEFGAQVNIQKDFLYPIIRLDENEPAVKLAAQAAAAIGCEPAIVSTGGGSDANILNGVGIPTVNLGIGMSKVHSVEEYITIDNLVLNARYVLEIIKEAAVLKS